MSAHNFYHGTPRWRVKMSDETDDTDDGDGDRYASRLRQIVDAIPEAEPDDVARLLEDGKRLCDDMLSDSDVGRAEAIAAAEAIGVIRIEKRGKSSAVESIRSYLAWLAYNADANRMARRATPW